MAEPDETNGEAKKRKPNAGSFKPGDPRIRPLQEKAAQAEPLDFSAVGDESTLYDDMRHVRRFPASMDRTEGQKDARKWKAKDLRGFMKAFADLEKVGASRPGKATVSGKAGGDGAAELELGRAWLLRHYPSKEAAIAEAVEEVLRRQRRADAEPDRGTELALADLGNFLEKSQEQEERENEEIAARLDAESIGRTRQQALRAALERERLLLNRVKELEARRPEPEGFGAILRGLTETLDRESRAENLELALRPDAAKVAATLAGVMPGMEERLEMLRRRVTELEQPERVASAPGTRYV
jgi:hypothetical protein